METPTEVIIVLVVLLLVLGVAGFKFSRNYLFGNKQMIDLDYKFNIAYVLGDDSKFERLEIKAWKDWKDSDAVQVITKDGKAIYTHLRNVKLVHE